MKLSWWARVPFCWMKIQLREGRFIIHSRRSIMFRTGEGRWWYVCTRGLKYPNLEIMSTWGSLKARRRRYHGGCQVEFGMINVLLVKLQSVFIQKISILNLLHTMHKKKSVYSKNDNIFDMWFSIIWNLFTAHFIIYAILNHFKLINFTTTFI